ncbi:MAG: hypothetical protein RMM58_15725 [Chloroflexota bacterium]|nr:hypothetical protein [Dehalococcoidia bacterium]MDW8255321.1 hypothetical protein [Chloroflexota bacterium]
MSSGTGLVETLWAGFATLNRRLDLLALPIAVNLVAWLGPRLTARPVVEGAGAAFASWFAAAAADPSLGLSAEQARQVSEELAAQMRLLASANLVTLVGWALPGMIALDEPLGQPVVELEGRALLGALVALLALGLASAAMFYQQVASAVRGESLRLLQLLGGVPRFVLRQAGWIAILLAAAAIAGVPFLLVIGLASILSPALGVAVLFVSWGLLLIAAWGLFFHTSAMFFDDVGPLRAVVGSVAVVARHRGPSLLFVAVVSLITTGWGLVWSGLEGVPASNLLRIAGHAYLSCGLVVATMIFYRDRTVAVVSTARAEQQAG